jgi:hypothetical protein
LPGLLEGGDFGDRHAHYVSQSGAGTIGSVSMCTRGRARLVLGLCSADFSSAIVSAGSTWTPRLAAFAARATDAK